MKRNGKSGSWSERLERLAELLEAGDAADLLEAIGAAARRGVEATEHGPRFEDALARARERADMGRVPVEALGVDELERGLGSIGAGYGEGEGSLELLERRERLEAVATAARLLGLDRRPLERRLEAVDRLGEARVGAFLHLNEARRAALDRLEAGARSGWWWGARIDCDREALAGLGIGAGADERELSDHLERCVHCQRDLRWLSRLDALLGPGAEGDHPSTADLLAHAAGEGEASSRETIARHLEGCPSCRELHAGARAGLAEADRVEAGLSLQLDPAPGTGSERADRPSIHLLLPVAAPAQPRALAADPAEEEPPVPSGRRVLWEPGALRLVFQEVAGRAELGLFGEQQAQADLAVTLDGERLEPVERAPGTRLYDLGPPARLVGRTLAVRLGGVERTWTLIEDKG